MVMNFQRPKIDNINEIILTPQSFHTPSHIIQGYHIEESAYDFLFSKKEKINLKLRQ